MSGALATQGWARSGKIALYAALGVMLVAFVVVHVVRWRNAESLMPYGSGSIEAFVLPQVEYERACGRAWRVFSVDGVPLDGAGRASDDGRVAARAFRSAGELVQHVANEQVAGVHDAGAGGGHQSGMTRSVFSPELSESVLLPRLLAAFPFGIRHEDARRIAHELELERVAREHVLDAGGGVVGYVRRLPQDQVGRPAVVLSAPTIPECIDTSLFAVDAEAMRVPIAVGSQQDTPDRGRTAFHGPLEFVTRDADERMWRGPARVQAARLRLYFDRDDRLVAIEYAKSHDERGDEHAWVETMWVRAATSSEFADRAG